MLLWGNSFGRQCFPEGLILQYESKNRFRLRMRSTLFCVIIFYVATSSALIFLNLPDLLKIEWVHSIAVCPCHINVNQTNQILCLHLWSLLGLNNEAPLDCWEPVEQSCVRCALGSQMLSLHRLKLIHTRSPPYVLLSQFFFSFHSK